MWFVSLLKNGTFFGLKLENRLKHQAILWFFVCGSKLRARWYDWIKDSCRAGKILSECIQMSFLPKM
jgi:hypothetical protein